MEQDKNQKTTVSYYLSIDVQQAIEERAKADERSDSNFLDRYLKEAFGIASAE
jgi:hypothetical protein